MDDNALLYTLIRQCSEDGSPALPMVKKARTTRDGRHVYKALKAYYQGSGASSVTVHRANTELKTLRYTGDRPRFTFDAFLARLLNAYEVIERETGLTYPDPIKVQTLLEKIDVSLLDIKVTKSAVSSNPEMKNDFASAYNFLSVEIGKHKSKIRSERSISAASRSNRSRNNQNDKPSRTLDQLLPLSGSDKFTDDEWWNVLQDEHRQEMQQLRKARKNNKRRSARAANRKRAKAQAKDTTDACDQFASQAKPDKEGKRTKTES